MTKRTAAQVERQNKSYRTNGKYAKVNPCYVCGKSAGLCYFSACYTDVYYGDLGLCLCEKCATKSEALAKAGKLEEHVRHLGGNDETVKEVLAARAAYPEVADRVEGKVV